jgi:hypothetical protein
LSSRFVEQQNAENGFEEKCSRVFFFFFQKDIASKVGVSKSQIIFFFFRKSGQRKKGQGELNAKQGIGGQKETRVCHPRGGVPESRVERGAL